MGLQSSNTVVLTEHGQKACGAKKRRQGEHCRKKAGFGTSHLGYGRCYYHGGASPAGIKAALTEQMEEETRAMRQAVMGTAIDIDPMEALLWCVRITAGEVAYSSQKVQSLEERDAITRPATETRRDIVGDQGASFEETQMPEDLNLWIKVRQASTERLARFSKMALDAGVEERRVRVAETAGEGLAQAIRSILDGLALSPAQEVLAPGLVRGALEVLEQAPAGGQILLQQ